jgi:hypothetical protein
VRVGGAGALCCGGQPSKLLLGQQAHLLLGPGGAELAARLDFFGIVRLLVEQVLQLEVRLLQLRLGLRRQLPPLLQAQVQLPVARLELQDGQQALGLRPTLLPIRGGRGGCAQRLHCSRGLGALQRGHGAGHLSNARNMMLAPTPGSARPEFKVS